MTTFKPDVTGEGAASLVQLFTAWNLHFVSTVRQNHLLGHFAFDLLWVQMTLQSLSVAAAQLPLHLHVANSARFPAELLTRMSIGAKLLLARQRALEPFSRLAATHHGCMLAIIQVLLHFHIAERILGGFPAFHFHLKQMQEAFIAT